ncbi:SHOCT domain-containing protein [Glutamicibacter sp. MNS18]|uniref:SHOCT domain-containing protein n=1 Tax=Glutamicibacter sp. MNS18 TaxID=2989817 RepID=UPI002235FDDE|nr:SHOCT domain-containing protein [Glutamicibacter sp. MNS18]MCW4466872.1 SHOCT domain-containing protein [Glutamicibacter sp. MNS18]
MDFFSSLWSVFWSTLVIFAFIAYLMALFTVIGDLFRDRSLNGWAKALWLVFLFFVPFLTVLVYLIARGAGMTERQLAQVERAKTETDAYIRSVSEISPAQSIKEAKALLDEGTITVEEYERLKAKALA